MALCFGYSKAIFRVLLVSAIVFFAILSPSAAATTKPSASAPSPASTPAHAPGPSSDGKFYFLNVTFSISFLCL